MKRVFFKMLSVLLSILMTFSVCSIVTYADTTVTPSYYVKYGGTGDGKTAETPAPTVAAAIISMNADGYKAGDTVNIYIMQDSALTSAGKATITNGYHNITSWRDFAAGEVMPSYTARIILQPYDTSITTYLAESTKYYDIHPIISLKGPTTIQYLTIVDVRSNYNNPLIAVNGNDFVYIHSNGYAGSCSLNSSGVLTNQWAPRISTSSGGTVNGTVNAEIAGHTLFGNFYIGSQNASSGAITYKEDVNITFNHPSIGSHATQTYTARIGMQNVTFEKNLNVTVKDVTDITFATDGSGVITVNGGVQYMVAPNESVLAHLTDLTCFAEGTKFYTLKPITKEVMDLITFTDVAGTYQIADGKEAVATDEEGNKYVSENGILTVPTGTYSVDEYIPPVTAEYFVMNGGTGDGSTRETPAASVSDVVNLIAGSTLAARDTALITILEREDWNAAPVNNVHNMAYISSIPVDIAPSIVIQGDPESETKVHLAYNSDLTNRHININDSATFENIVLVATPNGQTSYIYTNGNSLTFEEDVEFCQANSGWLGGTVQKGNSPNIWMAGWIDGNTYKKEVTYDIKGASVAGGHLYIPGNNYNNSTHNEDVSLILDNSEIGSETPFAVHFGPGGTGNSAWSSITATLKKNLNINVKNAAAVNFGIGDYPQHKLAVEGGIQLILNTATTYNTTDIAGISTVAAVTTNKVYILKNASGDADIIDFTKTAGTFKVADGKEVRAVNSNGDEIYSENGKLILTTGEWTISAYTPPQTTNYYVMNSGTGDGRTPESPAATVAHAIASVNEDKLDFDDIANIYIMQRDDWDTVASESTAHNMTSWYSEDKAISAHTAKIVVQSYDETDKSALAYYSIIGTGDITLGGPTVFKNINLVSTNSIWASIYADGKDLTFEQSTGFYCLPSGWAGGSLTSAWNPNVSLTKYITSGSYTAPQTVTYKTSSISDGALSIPGRCYNAASHAEDINIVLDNPEMGRVNPFTIKFAGNHTAAMTTVFEKNINITVKSASKIQFASGANENAAQFLDIKGGLQVMTNADTAFSTSLDDIDVFTEDTKKWFITLDSYADGNVSFTSVAGTYKVAKGISLMAVNEDGDTVTSTTDGMLILKQGNWTVSQNTLPPPDKMLYFYSVDGSPFMQRMDVVPGAVYNLTFSLVDSVSNVDIVGFTNGDRAAIEINEELLAEYDYGKYTTYHYSFTIPETAAAGLAFIGFQFPTSVEGYIFDIGVYKADDETQTQLFPNSDFKVGLNNWAYGWRAWFGVLGNSDLYEWNSEYGSFRVDNFDESLFNNVLPQRMLYIKETKIKGYNVFVQEMQELKPNTEYTVSFDYKFKSGSLDETLYFGIYSGTPQMESGYIYNQQLRASMNGDRLFDTAIDTGRNMTYTFTLTEADIGTDNRFFGGFYFLPNPDIITELYIHNLTIYESGDTENNNLFLDDSFADTVDNWYAAKGRSENGYDIFSRADTEYTAQYVKYKAEYFELQEAVTHYGDINADGVIDIRDLVSIKKLMAQDNKHFPPADIDKDSAVNASDTVLLKKHLLGTEVIEAWKNYKITLTEPQELHGGADKEAESLKNSILSAKDTVSATGTTYYIAENGNDSNNGTTPETAVTVAKLKSLPLTSGDAVLFNRGDTFRLSSSIRPVEGVSYGAYGSGDKPIISGSVRDYADKAIWSSEDGNIWQAQIGTNEAAHIVFDDGKTIGVRKISLDKVETDGDYYHDTQSGIIYLYLSQYNPGAYFDSIEISTTSYLIFSGGSSTNLTENVSIENLSFKYAATHAMYLICSKNFSIMNCEFAWIGGAYFGTDGKRLGNAIQFWSVADNCTASNNYFYEIFDAAITFQGLSENDYTNLTFENNLMEYCSMNFEFWGRDDTDKTDTSADPDATIKNISFSNNILRFSGYGFGGLQRKVATDQGFIINWHFGYDSGQVENVNICNNTFDTSNSNFFYTYNTTPLLNISGNTYYQQDGNTQMIVAGAGFYSNDQETFEEAIALIDKNPTSVVWLTEMDVALRSIKKIARIGWRVYEGGTPPEQSLASFEAAYEQGFRILLCDVRITLDGQFVCLHDDTINSVARNPDGSTLSEEIDIHHITLAQADEYDFGIKKGEQYRGTKILRLTEFLELCQRLKVTPHLEVKDNLSEEKLEELIALVKYYGFEDNIMFNGGTDNMRYIGHRLPNATMGKWVGNITDTLINEIASYGVNNKKFIYVSNGFDASITEENYIKCLEKGIDIGYTEIRSEEELAYVKEAGFLKYCKYVATRYFDLTE